MTLGLYASVGGAGRTPAAADEREAVLSGAYLASVRGLLDGVERSDGTGWRMQRESVVLNGLVADVVERLRALAKAAGFKVLHDGDAAREVVCCADPVWLRKIVAHLLLRALALEDAPPYVQLKISRSAGELHLRVLSSAPDAQRDAKGDLRAIQRLMTAMGAEVAIEPRRAGWYPICLVLTALPDAVAVREAAQGETLLGQALLGEALLGEAA